MSLLHSSLRLDHYLRIDLLENSSASTPKLQEKHYSPFQDDSLTFSLCSVLKQELYTRLSHACSRPLKFSGFCITIPSLASFLIVSSSCCFRSSWLVFSNSQPEFFKMRSVSLPERASFCNLHFSSSSFDNRLNIATCSGQVLTETDYMAIPNLKNATSNAMTNFLFIRNLSESANTAYRRPIPNFLTVTISRCSSICGVCWEEQSFDESSCPAVNLHTHSLV